MEVVGVIASCTAIANVVAKAYEFGDKMRDAQGLWEEYITSLKMLEKLKCLNVKEELGQYKSLVDVCAKMMEDIAEEVMDFLKKYALDKSKVERMSQWFKRQFKGYLFVYNKEDIRRRIENVHRVVDIFQLAVTMAAIALNSFDQSTTEQMLRDLSGKVVDQGLAMGEQPDSSTAELPAEIQTREDLVSIDGSEGIIRASLVGGAPGSADMPLTDAQELVNYIVETDNASELSSSASETLGASSTPSIPILPEVDVLVPRNTAYREVDDVLGFCIQRILLDSNTQTFILHRVFVKTSHATTLFY
ncbi:hypothetical protein SAPIO_CDS1751 [Scedosporium apiospermum]|uniref:Fungal N-terminal domain-containing protein n=1 Tax=Pseudallescheria apiosperma TaxID=563466 RepID=A0A084GDN2_PSEDA|nr:uncharacterized protein SAPIO_CDS1751 [Scedosporium apiospermum]KEZ45444.1 hypothetical protein SAPIO_CDS1751 [Scedosporium apiospermum]